MKKRFDSIKGESSGIIDRIMSSAEIPENWDFLMKFRLCTEEAVENIVNYAYEGEDGWLEAELLASEWKVTLRLKDSGAPFNPLEKENPNLAIPIQDRNPGGLGIYFYKKIMDSVSYEYKDGCNILTMTEFMDKFPLSQSQMGIWYACQNIGEDSGNYQVPFLYPLPQTIDLAKLKTALEAFVKVHPLVSSRISIQDGEPVFAHGSVSEVPVRDVDDIEDPSLCFGKAIDLLSDPLYRIEIYRTPNGNYLFTDFHHIIFDGISFNTLQDDIRKAYLGQTLENEQLSGEEYAIQELERRESEELDNQKEWYLKEFSAGAECDSRPSKSSINLDNSPFGIREKDCQLQAGDELLSELCRKHNVRKSTVATAAWAKLLADFSAEDKAAFCTIHNGRNDAGLSRTVSMMVRTLPVYSEMPSDLNISDWLRALQEQMDRTRELNVYSFSDLHSDLNFPSSIIFGYQGHTIQSADFPLDLGGTQIKCRDLRRPIPDTVLDAQLFVSEGLVLRIAYNTGLYSEDLISSMVESYSEILRSMKDAGTIADLNACSENQTKWLDRQNPECTPKRPEKLAERFRNQARLHPDSDCCVFEGKHYSYREVDCISDHLAACIDKDACQSDSEGPRVVSFICPRNEWMMIMPLSIVKAGYCYQPLDYSYPVERLSFMVEDARSELLLCTPELSSMVNAPSLPRMIVSSPEEFLNGDPAPEASLGDDDCTALLYTSGTTGTPKGVMMLQRNLDAVCQYNIKNMDIGPESRYASYASYGFDAFQLDLWSILSGGAAMHIIGESIRYDLEGINRYFIENGITQAIMTTQVGTQMAVGYPDIPSMKAIGVGGEKLVTIAPPKYNFINMYGPTETAVYISSHTVRENETDIPIGRPTETTRIYIVNKAGRRVPMGAAGELWASGPQLAAGYLRQEEKTAAAFISNPFFKEGDDPSYQRAYRTGDIVRFREDGELEFIGRKDGQVKIRGFRIELKEVEAVIRDFPGIKEVTVQAFDLEAGGKALAAYVVSPEKVDTDALGDFIRDRKPPYMVPAVTMQLDEIPLNVNGKVDKKQLPKPQINTAVPSSAKAAPLNRIEQELMDMISSLTGCSDFDIVTPLSYAGLSSISSMKLASQLFKAYGVQISAADLTHGASIQSIENAVLDLLLSRKDETVQGPDDAKEQDVRIERLLSAPVSNAQTGVYFECLKNPESTVYNIPTIIKFPDGTSPEAIKAAVEKLIEAHPVLSAKFDNSLNPPVIAADKDAKAQVSISELPVEELRKNFVKAFDLHKAPLYRAVVSGSTLLFDVHHLIMDGCSMDIFIKQLCSILDGKEICVESFSFFDSATEESKADDSKEKDFFDKELSDLEESTTLPADLHGKEEEGQQGEAVLAVDHKKISDFARTMGITPASVYLAALQYLAGRYTNSLKTCICTVSSGRQDSRIAETLGMFVNTLPICSEIKEESVKDYLQSTADNFTSVLQNERYPFAKIADSYGINADIMFVYELGVVEKNCVQGKELEMEELELSGSKSKFSLLVDQRGQDICLMAQYNDALYSAGMMERFLDSFRTVLDNMVSCPDSDIRSLSIISSSQQKELDRMNYGGDMEMPVRLLHKGMENWASKYPERTAVVACDATLSYKEFDFKANCIANALLEKGLKREDAVVVLLPRRSTTLCCIFGILKAGGAFIPCDPEYPSERIKLIAEDSGAPFVVTTAELVGNYGSRGICIDELVSCNKGQNPGLDIRKDNLAYYIYTSGSTGKPKGVAVEHGNITTCFSVCPEHPNYPMANDCERICSVFTISFDAFVLEFGMSMFHGRTFIFSDEIQSKDPVELAALIKKTGADYIGGTSSRLLQYLELPEFRECIKKCKFINQGGEKFQEVLLERLRELNPGACIMNGYGPTEISISCNACNLQHESVITVGRPQPNYYEWILDKNGNELPVGVTGELCVGGEGVTRGYRNLPEKTAEKYILYRGMRAFKTGDYARWYEDGKVEILGRTDNQVKLRGLRIELGEVESAISKVDGVKNVLVKICNLNGNDHLCAYFIADHLIDISELRKSIGQTLTAYMVPDAYLQMDAFPLSPNGKVDFRHLPQPVLAKSDREYVAPANETEKFFADCFAKILSVDKVSANDSFFELGGTSLVVMRVVIEAQKAGYQITYPDIFSNPSPKQLAAFLGKGAVEDNDPDSDIGDFDFSQIDEKIKSNHLDTFLEDRELRNLGNILLTGATGFLGIHILNCLLQKYPSSSIYCLLRSKKGIPAKDRLRQMMFYYFERDVSDLLDKRLFVIEGDVTMPIVLDGNIDTVINCAALVKHFAKGNEIEEINVGGVRRCVEFCLEKKARLIQISTYSVGGTSVDGKPDVKAFDETMLWIGQRIHNQYVHSKIMGERLILDAVARKGLDAKIMRVGNLSARSADGEFQINLKANSFMGRLRIFQMLGVLPYSAYLSTVEFSPIDQTAEAICLLAGTNSSCTIFHPYNNHVQMLGDVMNRMESIGKNIRMVEDREFSRILTDAKENENTREDLSAMLAYETRSSGESIRVISPDNNFTMQTLLRLGFRWNPTSWDYVDQFLRQIDSLNFFQEDR